MYRHMFTKDDYKTFTYLLDVLAKASYPVTGTGHAYTGVGHKHEVMIDKEINIDLVPLAIRATLATLVQCELIAIRRIADHYQPNGKRISYSSYYLYDTSMILAELKVRCH